MKIVILAGGKGTRLWPMSRAAFPKQFLKIGDELSLLQRTVCRFLPLASTKSMTIVTSSDYQHLVLSQLQEIEGGYQGNILIEPCQRGTAPAIALAVKYLQDIEQLEEGEAILVVSSDNWISPEAKFLEAVETAEKAVKKGQIVVFGVQPTKPETGYGYIRVNKDEKTEVKTVLSFIEKPGLAKAEEYAGDGGYLWNCGIFAFTSARLWNELQIQAPDIFSQCNASLSALKESFASIPHISFDYAVMEKAQNVSVVPLQLTWSDVGSWDSLYEVLEKDENQNAKIGNIVDMGTTNCLIVGGKRLISTIGLDDLHIVETEDALFIGKKGESQQVKALVDELTKKGMKQAVEHRTTYRPWGSYTVLEEGERFKVKRIRVEPHQKLSLQFHYHRSEHWVVVKGTARVRIGEKEHYLHENESIYVPKSTVHRLENPGKVPLEMMEVQVGEYVGEDDIVRLEDVYGRVQEQSTTTA